AIPAARSATGNASERRRWLQAPDPVATTAPTSDRPRPLMPLHWTVSHEQELVHAIATGELNTDDLQAYLGAVIAAQAMPYGKIFDMSKATSLAGASRLSEVADTVRLYGKMKLGAI